MYRDYVTYSNQQGDKLRGLRERPHQTVQKRCIVLCHGHSVDKDELGAFVVLSDALIAAGHDVLRFDMRGSGQSDRADYEQTITSQQEDIETTLDYLSTEHGYESFVIVAASFSGTAAVPVVARTKHQIDGLIMRNAVVDLSYKSNPPTDFLTQRIEKRKQEIVKQGYAETGPWKFRLGAKLYQEMLSMTPQQYVGDISCPITMIHGTEDQYVPYDLSKSYADRYDHVEIITIQGATHGFHDGSLGQAVDACVQTVLALSS